MRKESIWMIAIAIMLCFGLQQYWTHNQVAPTVVPYSKFIDAVHDGMVLKADIPRELDGNIVATLKDGKTWSTIAPHDIWMVSDLTKYKVEVVAHSPEQGNVFVNLLLNLIPTFIIVGLIIWMMRKSGSGGVFSMSKNPAKKGGEKSDVRFTDVAGIDEAKEEVSELVDYLKNPTKYAKLGGRSPRGILLAGEPGTGKTLLVKAIAGEAGVPFFSATGSSFVEMFVGMGAKRVRELFEDARKVAPSIIYIDEIDAIGRQRSNQGYGGNQETEQTLMQILTEMDGFDTGTGVLVLASTNRADVLDKALLRPGRFDRHVQVPNPDVKGREQILKVHAAKSPLAPNVVLKTLAQATPGFSGADLANMCNEAALHAAKMDRRLVDMADFEFAKDKAMMGAERKTMVMSLKERTTTAYHEAGHAAIGMVLGEDPVYKVTIMPRGRALGATVHIPQEDRNCYSKKYFDSQMVMLMGGRAAEEIYCDQRTTGASNDIKRASGMARRMIREFGMSELLGPVHYGDNEGQGYDHISEAKQLLIDNEIERIVTKAYADAVQVMKDYRPAIEKMTQLLLEKETIDRFEVEACFPEDIQARARLLWAEKPLDGTVIAPDPLPVDDDQPRVLGDLPAMPAGAVRSIVA